ncbi:DUF2189 domain-containing protein [Chthonobacter rhizosphaerae]|uniref:DUF2189 domain-containing protein n=1 Tax=Chthonobacter rhizosphaerae TaxID=2735553 RepID=UPI0015EEFDDD|nr:DUF2189 domain-containing protein [Chthonobacter rhizosphaerae]
MTIRNPAEWSSDHIRATTAALRTKHPPLYRPKAELDATRPTIRSIEVSDLKDVLRKGLQDFGAYRMDVIFISIVYPLAGLVLARAALGRDLLPLVFPLASGFALIGPFAASGLYELSRRREQGLPVSWTHAFSIFRNPSIGAILELGLILAGIFLFWLATAMAIYNLTLGPEPPASIGSFFQDVFTTGAGWAMIVLGVGIGFLFALLVLAISAVSFPLLLDRRVSLSTAIGTSVRAMMVNPVPMLAWGGIVAGSLVLGAIPLLCGLIIVMPVLGHATWHLYRRVVE